MSIKRVLSIAAVVACLMLFASGLQAQADLTYGSAADGSIHNPGDSITFTFDGTAGDLVFIRVINVTTTLNTVLTLSAADNSETISVTSGELAHRLASSGSYQISITGQNGTTGDFILRLDARTGIPLSLALGQITSAAFAVDGPPQTFHFDQSASEPLILTISADNPAFRFATEVRDAQGQVTAYFSPKLRSAILTVPRGNGSFDVTITAADPSVMGTVLLDLETESGSPAPTIAPASTTIPAATPAPGTTPQATTPPAATSIPLPGGSGTVYCRISANGSGANIRSAPDANAPILERLTRSKSVEVIGLSADGAWFAVRLTDKVGWVGKQVARQIEPCVNVPVFNP